jgi:hypothetical protein
VQLAQACEQLAGLVGLRQRDPVLDHVDAARVLTGALEAAVEQGQCLLVIRVLGRQAREPVDGTCRPSGPLVQRRDLEHAQRCRFAELDQPLECVDERLGLPRAPTRTRAKLLDARIVGGHLVSCLRPVQRSLDRASLFELIGSGLQRELNALFPLRQTAPQCALQRVDALDLVPGVLEGDESLQGLAPLRELAHDVGQKVAGLLGARGLDEPCQLLQCVGPGAARQVLDATQLDLTGVVDPTVRCCQLGQAACGRIAGRIQSEGFFDPALVLRAIAQRLPERTRLGQQRGPLDRSQLELLLHLGDL